MISQCRCVRLICRLSDLLRNIWVGVMEVNTSLESWEDASAIVKEGEKEERRGFSAEFIYQVTTLFP